VVFKYSDTIISQTLLNHYKYAKKAFTYGSVLLNILCLTMTHLRPLCWFILALGATPSTAIKNNFRGWIIRNKTCRIWNV